MNKVLSLVFLCCVFACQQKAEKLPVQKEQNLEEIDQEDVTTISSITTDYDTLINRVKKRGDVDAYDELFIVFKIAVLVQEQIVLWYMPRLWQKSLIMIERIITIMMLFWKRME